MSSHVSQTLHALGLLLLLAALTDPFMYWMPSVPQMLTLVLATAGLAAWIGFVARESVGDEREAEHRMFAGRVAYLAGIGVLTLALVLEGLSHTLDPWIPIALSIMVASKLGARWYADKFW